MINARILREAENASVPVGVNKQVLSEKKLPRLKAKALGDVQNTLYSRPAITAPNTNSVKKASHKSHLEFPKTTEEKKIGFTPTSKTIDNIENIMSEIHNHKLCEEESFVNSYFEQYKFTDDEINNLIHSARKNVFMTPLTIESFEPCEDVKISNDFEENVFSVDDIFSDMNLLPRVPSPVEICNDIFFETLQLDDHLNHKTI